MKLNQHIISTLVSLLILLICAISLISALNPYGSATSPDSLAYLDIAANIKDGHGWVASDLSLNNAGLYHFVENRVWPPLYSSLMAIVVSDPFDTQAVSLISLILLFLTAVLIFIILVKYHHWLVALPSTLMVMIGLPMITVYTYAWSETLFIPLLLIAALSAINFIENARRPYLYRFIWLGSLILALVLLAFTRYIGVALALIILAPMAQIIRQRDSRGAWFILIGTIFYAMLVGYLMISNYQIAGSVTGSQRTPSDTGFLENALAAQGVLGTIWPSSLAQMGVALIFAMGLTYVMMRASEDAGHDVSASHPIVAIKILLWAGGLYIVSLLLMRSHSQFDDIDVRLMAPAFPLLMIAIILLPRLFVSKKRSAVLICVLPFFLLSSFALKGYAQFNASRENWKNHNSPGHFMIGNLRYNNFTQNPATDSIRFIFNEVLSPQGVVVVMSRPLIWRFMTRRATFSSPAPLTGSSFEKMSALADGSLLILNQDDLPQFELLIAEQRMSYEGIKIGDVVGVKLPLKSAKSPVVGD